LVDEKFHQLFGDISAAAYEFPSEVWEKSYAVSGPRIRVLSPPWTVRFVILGNSPEEVRNIPRFSNASTDAYRRYVPLVRMLFYRHLVKHVSGMPGTASVVSDPEADIPGETSISPVYVASDREEMEYRGNGFVAMKVIPVTSSDHGALERSWVLRQLLHPRHVMPDAPKHLKAGVLWERIGKLLLVAPWVRVDSERLVDKFFSAYSTTTVFQRSGVLDMLGTRSGEDYVRQGVVLMLKMSMLSPVSRLLRILDFVSVYGKIPELDERDILRRTPIALLRRSLKVGLERAGEVLFRGDAV